MIIIIYFCHNYHYYYEQLEQVKQFKYFIGRSMPGSGTSTNEVKIRAAAMAMSSLAKMDKKGKGQTTVEPRYFEVPRETEKSSK